MEYETAGLAHVAAPNETGDLVSGIQWSSTGIKETQRKTERAWTKSSRQGVEARNAFQVEETENKPEAVT